MDFERWEDHDSVQEVIMKSRPICICCGGRVLEGLGIICKQCLEKDKEEYGNGNRKYKY